MKKVERKSIFKKAHKIAKMIIRKGDNYKATFTLALKFVYSKIKREEKEIDMLFKKAINLADKKMSLLSKSQMDYVINTLKYVNENSNHWNILSLVELNHRLENI